MDGGVLSVVASWGRDIGLVIMGFGLCFGVFKVVMNRVNGTSKRAPQPCALPKEDSIAAAEGALDKAATSRLVDCIDGIGSIMDDLPRRIRDSMRQASGNEDLLQVLGDIKLAAVNLSHAIQEQGVLFDRHGILLGQISESINVIQKRSEDNSALINGVLAILKKEDNK